MKNLKRQRQRLWKADPHCENCGVLTVLPEDVDGATLVDGKFKIKVTPPNMATIQHKYSKLNPERRRDGRGTKRHLLWCFKCNNDDNKKETAALPIELLHALSKRHG